MRVYIAAAYERQEEMRGVRDLLIAFGHDVTSTWIDKTDEPPGGLGAEHLAADPMTGIEFARLDLREIDAAEIVLSFTGTTNRGGRHIEFGYGLAQHKYLIVVGAKEHIFHTLAAEWYPDWTGLVMAITGRPLHDNRRSALYFSFPDDGKQTEAHPDPATELMPAVIVNGAPADPGPATRFWPFGNDDARRLAVELGVEQKTEAS